MFDLALKLIEQKRISKANQLLSNLNKQIHNNSYVVLYDLAITAEALGDLQKAYSLLKNAEDIAISKNKLIKEISSSIQRVKNNIDQINKVQKNSLK
jgi:tetratricopeptide (TPR) repeat protein